MRVIHQNILQINENLGYHRAMNARMGDLTYSKKLVKASLKSYMELIAEGNVNLAKGGVRCLFFLFL